MANDDTDQAKQYIEEKPLVLDEVDPASQRLDDSRFAFDIEFDEADPDDSSTMNALETLQSD